ncbi:MAG: hypothetical protein ACPHUF_00785 [Gammaproteobacteria bacterium]
MKNLITVIALSLTSNVVMADTFAPWNERGASFEREVKTQEETLPTGFAPWRGLPQRKQSVGTAVRFSDLNSSAFRPWS